MDLTQYKEQMTDIAMQTGKFVRGAKYVRQWDKHFSEKEYMVKKAEEFGMLTDVKTAIDIGTGVGMLPYVLMQKGIHVEATDIEEEVTGPMFKKCCDLINLKRHHLYIYNGKPMDFPGKYDLFIASRTEFDREFLEPGETFDYIFFLNDVFQYVDKVFIKTNNAGSGKGYPDWLVPYLYNPGGEGVGKPYRAWYIHITKEQWLNDPNSAK